MWSEPETGRCLRPQSTGAQPERTLLSFRGTDRSCLGNKSSVSSWPPKSPGPPWPPLSSPPQLPRVTRHTPEAAEQERKQTFSIKPGPLGSANLWKPPSPRPPPSYLPGLWFWQTPSPKRQSLAARARSQGGNEGPGRDPPGLQTRITGPLLAAIIPISQIHQLLSLFVSGIRGGPVPSG